MKIKYVILFMLITILSGCNLLASNKVPEDINPKYYKGLVESYEIYEERVKKYDGNFTDDNKELIEFDEETFFDTEFIEIASEDRKKKEKGKESNLSQKEEELKSDFIELYTIKTLDYLFNGEGNLEDIMIENNPEYKNPIQASIDLEKKIIETLELDKEPVTQKLNTELSEENNEFENTDINQDFQGSEYEEENTQEDIAENNNKEIDKYENGFEEDSTPEINSNNENNSSDFEKEEDLKPSWKNEEKFNDSLEELTEYLNELQDINDGLMTLDLDQENSEIVLNNLEQELDNFESLIQDSETKKYLNEQRFEDTKRITEEITEIISSEEKLIENLTYKNDIPPTDEIKIVEQELSEVIIDISFLNTNDGY